MTEYSRIDGSKTIFWARKRAAIAAARAIGWRASDVHEVHTRFCIGWAIHQPVIGGWMSRERYAELLASATLSPKASHIQENHHALQPQRPRS